MHATRTVLVVVVVLEKRPCVSACSAVCEILVYRRVKGGGGGGGGGGGARVRIRYELVLYARENENGIVALSSFYEDFIR